MISKMFRIALTIVLASFALSSAAWATCSNASLSGTYGFLHGNTDSNGTPTSAAVSQLTFDATTSTFTGETTASHDGVIATAPLTGTYTVASNCTGTGYPAGGSPFSFVVTSTGFLALHLFAEGFAVKQGSPTCTDAGVGGSFGFETTGVSLAGAPATAVAFIGELKLMVNRSGEGVISGHLAASEDGTFLRFSEVRGSYSVDANCTGTATITPKGRSAMNFSFVIVDCGKEMLAIETDANTVVSGTLVKDSDDSGESAATSVSRGQEVAQIAQSQKFNELLHAFPKDIVASDGKTSPGTFDFKLWPPSYDAVGVGTPISEVKGTTAATRIAVD